MLMDPPVMQVDCQLQNDVEKASSIGYGRKHTLSHDDYGWTGSDVHPTNDAIISDSVEVNNASQTGIDEVSGAPDNTHVNVDDLPHGSEVSKTNNSDDAYSDDVRFQLNLSTGNTGSQTGDGNINEQSSSMEDAHHPQDEAHPPPSTVSLLRSCESNGDARPSQEEKITEERAKVDVNVDAASKEVGTDLVGSHAVQNESNGDARPSQEEKITEERAKVDVNVDAASKEVGTDLVGSHAVQNELQCTLQDLSEIACTIDLGRNKSSLQEEKETSVSPINDMDQLVHNNICNGGTNYKAGEVGAGNSGYEEDHAVALWVKSGEENDRQGFGAVDYIVVFFPRTRTYSWVDMLLVLPIEQYPLPLVNGTHRKWRNLVKDLSVPRRFVMQKLAIAMLNLSDELHIEAVIENARKATTWKEFALEASCCKDYTDLGKMLVKLRNVILPDYISSQWLQSSFDIWSRKCNNAYDAETIEILYELFYLDNLKSHKIEVNASVLPRICYYDSSMVLNLADEAKKATEGKTTYDKLKFVKWQDTCYSKNYDECEKVTNLVGEQGESKQPKVGNCKGSDEQDERYERDETSVAAVLPHRGVVDVKKPHGVKGRFEN
ncbi:hypothetical protein ACP70R_028224 [Stipagrostis hirtigluma subsp. patula]